MFDVFIICPVRIATDYQKAEINECIEKLKKQGKTVYYPATDTNQIDETGFGICTNNTNAIKNSKEVYIYYDKTSQGSLFDLGVAFALNKPLTIINKKDIVVTQGKSFANMILYWSEQ